MWINCLFLFKICYFLRVLFRDNSFLLVQETPKLKIEIWMIRWMVATLVDFYINVVPLAVCFFCNCIIYHLHFHGFWWAVTRDTRYGAVTLKFLVYFIFSNYYNLKLQNISYYLNFVTFLNNVMLYFCIKIILM